MEQIFTLTVTGHATGEASLGFGIPNSTKRPRKRYSEEENKAALEGKTEVLVMPMLLANI